MSLIWTLMAAVSLLYGIFAGTLGDISAAVIEGAGDAVSVTLSLTGAICLWSGVTKVIERIGGMRVLSRAAAPILRRLFRESSKYPEIINAISANMAANILGLGNAATPPGIRAASLMCSDKKTVRDLCTLIVINTSSIQLIPATAAALRGSGQPHPSTSSPRYGAHPRRRS